jgi:hypothetical protein
VRLVYVCERNLEIRRPRYRSFLFTCTAKGSDSSWRNDLNWANDRGLGGNFSCAEHAWTLWKALRKPSRDNRIVNQ